MTFLTAIAFFAVFAFGALVHMTTLSFAAAMRRFHPQVWQAHASPGWLGFRSSPWAVVRFIRSGSYKHHVSAPRVLVLGRRLEVLQRIQLLMLAAFLLAVLVLVTTAA